MRQNVNNDVILKSAYTMTVVTLAADMSVYTESDLFCGYRKSQLAFY